MKGYDLLIIGAGPAGVMAARGASAEGLSVLVLEKGVRLASRRDLAIGWFGHGLHAFDRMEGDGMPNIRSILDLCRSANSGRLEHRKGRGAPQSSKHKMRLLPCGHYRVPPAIASELAKTLYCELKPVADIVFQTDVKEVVLGQTGFVAVTDRGKFTAKRCILATGSRSAEWIMDMCSSLGTVSVKPTVRLGVRVETSTKLLSVLVAKQGDILTEQGPVRFDDARFGGFVGEWEDFGMVSAFGHTLPDKHSQRTNFMASFAAENGFIEAMRVARIVNVLSNDKVRRERIYDFMQGKSVLKHIPQFECLIAPFIEFDRLVPKFIATAVIHVPETRIGGALPVGEDMRTALPGLYGAGQCVAGTRTLLEAMASGLTAAQSVTEDKDNE